MTGIEGLLPHLLRGVRRLALVALLALPILLAAGCATSGGDAPRDRAPAPGSASEPSPAPAAPPAVQTASLADSVRSADARRARLFAAIAIDGRAVGNSFDASAEASRAAGGKLRVVVTERRVPPRPLRVTLRAGYTPMPPGVEAPAEGTVAFTPRAGGRYVVRGELRAGNAAVWIEDLDSGERVSERVVGEL